MNAAMVLVFGLIVTGAIAGVVVLIVFSVRRERERMERLQQWAAGQGWTITRKPAVDWTSQLPGRNRRGVSLLLSGTYEGYPVSVGEYSYTTSSGSGSNSTTTTHRFVVTAVRLPNAYPPIAVEARGGLSRLGRSMFGDNAAATGQDAFDEQFRVKTKDPNLSRTLLGPTLITEHIHGQVPPWSLAGNDLLTWRSGRIEHATEIPSLAASLVRVAAIMGR